MTRTIRSASTLVVLEVRNICFSLVGFSAGVICTSTVKLQELALDVAMAIGEGRVTHCYRAGGESRTLPVRVVLVRPARILTCTMCSACMLVVPISRLICFGSVELFARVICTSSVKLLETLATLVRRECRSHVT